MKEYRLCNSLNHILIVLAFALFFVGCSRHCEDKTISTVDSVPSFFYLKYDEPLNGYDVMLCCKQVYAENPFIYSISISLKHGDRIIIEDILNSVSFERLFSEMECMELMLNDTTIIHNTHKENGCPFFDCNNIVYFEDMDFDEKDELVVCTYPTEHSSSDIMDCESYLAFEVYSYYLHQNDNRFTRRIAGDLCRTDYSIDRKNKTVSLTGYLNAYESVKEVYWFNEGQPYRFDYSIVVNEEKTEYHFMIDRIDAVIDSIELSRYNFDE